MKLTALFDVIIYYNYKQLFIILYVTDVRNNLQLQCILHWAHSLFSFRLNLSFAKFMNISDVDFMFMLAMRVIFL